MITALEGVSGQRHAPVAFYPRLRPGTHCTGGWVDPRAGLDRCGKSCSTGIRYLDRPARRQSLYRLRYPAHSTTITGLRMLGWKPVLTFVERASRGKGCAMAPAVSHLPVNTEAQVRSQLTLFWICGVLSGTGTGVSPSTFAFPCQNYSTNAPYPFVMSSTV